MLISKVHLEGERLGEIASLWEKAHGLLLDWEIFFNILNVYIPVYTLNICIHIQGKKSNYQIITEPDKIIFHLLYLSGDATGPQVSWENILEILKNLNKNSTQLQVSMEKQKDYHT